MDRGRGCVEQRITEHDSASADELTAETRVTFDELLHNDEAELESSIMMVVKRGFEVREWSQM